MTNIHVTTSWACTQGGSVFGAGVAHENVKPVKGKDSGTADGQGEARRAKEVEPDVVRGRLGHQAP